MNLGDVFRDSVSFLDEVFIESAGRQMIHVDTGTLLRAFYEVPTSSSSSTFGFDAPDEMTAEFGYRAITNRLGTPNTDELFLDETGGMWKVVGIRRKDDLVKGQNRLVVTFGRYQEATAPQQEETTV